MADQRNQQQQQHNPGYLPVPWSAQPQPPTTNQQRQQPNPGHMPRGARPQLQPQPLVNYQQYQQQPTPGYLLWGLQAHPPINAATQPPTVLDGTLPTFGAVTSRQHHPVAETTVQVPGRPHLQRTGEAFNQATVPWTAATGPRDYGRAGLSAVPGPPQQYGVYGTSAVPPPPPTFPQVPMPSQQPVAQGQPPIQLPHSFNQGPGGGPRTGHLPSFRNPILADPIADYNLRVGELRDYINHHLDLIHPATANVLFGTVQRALSEDHDFNRRIGELEATATQIDRLIANAQGQGGDYSETGRHYVQGGSKDRPWKSRKPGRRPF